MPQIYTMPIPLTVRTSPSGSENVSDGNNRTFYETSDTDITIEFTMVPDVSTFYILAENFDSVSLTGFTGATQHGFGNDLNGVNTINNRKGILSTVPEVGIDSCILRFTRTSGRSTIKIYRIVAMRRLLDLNQTNDRAITSFETRREIRNAFIQEDLYGTRSLQTGHLNDSKKTINYTIWQIGSNITAARNKLSDLYDIQRQYSNFMFWDLDEAHAQDYESVFPAFWVPESFSERTEGAQAISYSFSVEQQ